MRRILLLVILALAAFGVWSLVERGRVAPRTPAPLASPADPAARAPEVAIQDRKTIDFSTGKPVIKDSAAEQAAIDRAVKQMDAAAAGVTFGPTAAPSTPTTK